MIQALRKRIGGMERDFMLFLVVGVFLGIGQSVDGSVINNFLKDKLHFIILQRSAIEIPRELPGFLVFLVIGFLYTLGDMRIAVVANILSAVGMFALGIVPPHYSVILMCMFVYSMGMHLYMPLSSSIGMSFAGDGRVGRKLGQVSAANTAALVVSSAILFLLFKYAGINFTVSFTIGAVAFLLGSICLAMINPRQTVKLKNRFVFRREYSLFYMLSVLYGARKQIFITFGPWVLVDVFKQKVATMTILFFTISVLGIFFKPFIGFLIDRMGEKFVLCSEAIVLFFVCLGYAFADVLIPGSGAVIIIVACYIIDQTMSAVSMARSTYLQKIAVKKEDVSPSLSTGMSIDHIVSMFIPSLGGYIWYSSGAGGYKYVFLGGAVIAVLNFFTARHVRSDR